MAGKIAVQFFGLMRGRVGTKAVELEVDELPVLELLRRVEKETGKSFLDELLDRDLGLLTGTIILVDGENIRLAKGLATSVRAGQVVALFSPAGGG